MPRSEFDAAFRSWFLEHERTHVAFIALAERSAVGMAWLATIDRVPGPGVWTRLAGHLQSVYVRLEDRNQGIGAALVTEALKAAERRGFDYVIVHPSERSFPLYRRLGFCDTGAFLEHDVRASRPSQ